MEIIIYQAGKKRSLFLAFTFILLIQLCSATTFAQTSAEANAPNEKSTAGKTDLPQVTQIDGDALSKLLKPNGKPVLVNFWATWCGPCVEEFPELVKINADYKEKLDVKAISLDDLAEINRDVPAFLAKVKSEIPAFLLKTPDEDTTIQSVDKSWQGGLPFTILIGADGKVAYTRQGILNPKTLREEIDKLTVK